MAPVGLACLRGVSARSRSFPTRPMREGALRIFSNRFCSTPVVTSPPVEKIRNIAVIAHVDHGKTTLVDSLLRLTNDGAFHGSMDCNELERERGITILSKCTRMTWKGHTLNVVDTPGHADFGGEVERVMSMVDGVLLVVDINEGPKPQTKFVLSKALALKHLKPIVMVNKVDRLSGSRSNSDIENEIFDLFATMDPTDAQMEYPTLFGSGKAGWAVSDWDLVASATGENSDLSPVLDSIISHVAHPSTNDQSGNFAMLVTTIDFIQSSNLGALGLTVSGKIYSGKIKKGDFVFSMDRNGVITGKSKIRDITVMRGLDRESIGGFVCGGDIVSLSFSKEFTPNVTDTLCTVDSVIPIPSIPIDPPLLSLRVTRNDSPLAGQDGSLTSLELLAKRLKREAIQNVAIDVTESPNKDGIEVKGRGELQLGILVETMRREGYEMSLSAPNILTIKDEFGKTLEPFEEVKILIPESLCGIISDKMMSKDAEMIDMIQKPGGMTEMDFVISTRNWLGLRSTIRDMSGGQAIVISAFKEYQPMTPVKPSDRNSAVVAVDSGLATYYDLEHAWRKATMFIKERSPVYTGMVIGEHKGKQDLDIAIAKGEQRAEGLRRKNKEEKTSIPNAQEMSLEMALSYILPDEQIEITPKRISIRKRILDTNARRQEIRKEKKTNM